MSINGSTSPNPLPDSPQNSPMPEIERVLNSWLYWRRFWKVTHYVLGVVGTFLAAAIASKVSIFDQNTVWPWLATVCVGLLTLLAPMKKAKGYYDAHAEVTDAYSRYRMAQIRPEDVLNKLRDGRTKVGASLDS